MKASAKNTGQDREGIIMRQATNAIPAKRQQCIMEYLSEKRSITIREAARLCGVSEATARRDLDEMAHQSLLERTHGGAVLERGTGLEMVHDEKMKVMIPEKTRIAKAAVKLIKEGDSIFLDSGTTTLLLSGLLQGIPNLTVITYNLDIAYSVKLDKTSALIVTGGIRRDGYGSLVGPIAEDMIRGLSVDFAFLGADAISVRHGVFNSNFVELGVKRSAIACGQTRVLLSDHTKFKHKALTKVCDMDEFDVVITDNGLDQENRKLLEDKVRRLILV